MSARIEHVNVTVKDTERTAEMLCAVFGWYIRWQGKAANGGNTIHVGTEEDYLAVHTPPAFEGKQWAKGRPLNHVGVVVPDLDAVDARVRDFGLVPFGHDDYEPGRRFYFLDDDGVEFEVVSYD